MGRPLVAGAVTVVLAGAVACGGAPVVAGSGRPADTSSGSSSAGSSGSSSTGPAPSPSVTPAVGTTYDAGEFTFVLPDGFVPAGDVGQGSGILSNSAFQDPTRQVGVFVSTLAVYTPYDLEQSAQLAADTFTPGSRQPDREVGGEPVYVYDDPAAGPFTREFRVGRPTRNDSIVTITVVLARGLAGQDPADPAADQALIESVLATVTWRS